MAADVLEAVQLRTASHDDDVQLADRRSERDRLVER
jgi:hypothetical protein